MKKTLLWVGISLLTIFHGYGYIDQFKWMILYYVSSIAIGYLVGKRFGIVPGTLSAWILGSSIWIYADQTPITQLKGEQILSLENVVMQSTIAFLMIIMAITLSSKTILKSLEEGFSMLCLADSLYVIVQYFMDVPGPSRGGFLANPSMNGSFLAVTYPLLVFSPQSVPWAFKKKWRIPDGFSFILDMIILFAPVYAMFLSQASIPIGGLFLSIIPYFLFNEKDMKMCGILSFKQRLFTTMFLLFFIGLNALIFIPDLFFSTGRLQVWKAVLKWFKQGDQIWGGGLGTFFLIGPVAQSIYHVGETMWFGVAHNDWLQIYIELGAIGLFLALLTFILSLVKSYQKKKYHLMSSILALGGIACFNFPLRSAPFSLLTAILLARIFDES